MVAEPREHAQLLQCGQDYLRAVEAHEPARAALNSNVRCTHNGRAVKAGEGFWRELTRFASRQSFADPVSGQVVMLGAAETRADLFPYSIRLRIVDGRISEVETLLSSSNRGHFAAVDQLLKPDVLYDAPVPASRGCQDRDQLQRLADSYWTALNESDGSLANFGYRCDRYANGKRITNSLELLLSPDAAVHTVASLITATRPARPKVLERRFPVIDLERGVVISFAAVEFQKPPNAARKDFGAFYICALVKLVDGEFRMVDHIHEILPPGTRSGW
jgi:hypothetical protein